MDDQNILKTTQIGWFFLSIIFALNVYLFFSHKASESLIIVLPLSIVLLSLFNSLRIEITSEVVKFSMGIGLIRGQYKLSEIKSCKSISYIPFGWGIRVRFGATLFTVSGRKAIELIIRNRKRKIFIGTNNPDELVEYINKRLKTS